MNNSNKGMKGFISASSVRRKLASIGCQMSKDLLAALNKELDNILTKSAERAKLHGRITVREVDL